MIGAEKMTAVPSREASEHPAERLLPQGRRRTPWALRASLAGSPQAYFERHGDHSEELAMIAAKNHANAVHNPYAHVRKDLRLRVSATTVSERNPLVAGPLRRTDCSMVSDGAAALVLADEETAAALRRAIRFRARTQVNDFLPLSRRDPIAFEGARLAWDKAKDQAGVSLDDLSLVETHDCFTIAEMIEYEAMGLAQAGRGLARDPRRHDAAKDGQLPVNVSGGLKAKGHPLGATGVSHARDGSHAACRRSGRHAVTWVELAGVFNMGGAAVANYVSILERTK